MTLNRREFSATALAFIKEATGNAGYGYAL